MSTKPNVIPLKELLTKMEETIDALVADEREEQTAILNRETAALPVICGRIDKRTLELDRLQTIFVGSWSPSNPPTELVEPSRHVFEKLKNLQKLTIQNHLLLEHHLNFLQEIHREVLGIKQKPFLYDDNGAMPRNWAESGSLLNAQA